MEELVCLPVKLAEELTDSAHKLVDRTILERAEDLEDGAMVSPETLFTNLQIAHWRRNVSISDR